MLVDDDGIFELPLDPNANASFMARSGAYARANGQSGGPVTDESLRLLDDIISQQSTEAGAQQLDAAGHRRRAGILSLHEGNVALWATQGYAGPIGPIARSGPMLSPVCRERMLTSLEQDAPTEVCFDLPVFFVLDLDKK